MVLSKEEIMEQVKGIIGENTDDTSLKFLEDLSDTIADYETKANSDDENWKEKYETNDKEWRKKYQERFFSGTPNEDDKSPQNDLIDPNGDDKEGEDNSPKHFEELFTQE